MEFVPPPKFNIQLGRPPLWVNSTEWGFYGFKPTICALCCLKTHDILQFPKGNIFSAYQYKKRLKRELEQSLFRVLHSKFEKKHLEHYFEQSNMPQELSMEDKLSKLLE
ncbi:hypothetical protein DVH24_000076 [Malus domestica]|uniref:Uncharacterized protein n=1 Tax=Malus domestica TaxID=3750 RepID=A0A498J1P3_MALDO|nr:hypothetical protein DVH24_000076 [Malus domestica]